MGYLLLPATSVKAVPTGSGRSDSQDNLRNRHHFVYSMWVVLGVPKRPHLQKSGEKSPQDAVYATIVHAGA